MSLLNQFENPTALEIQNELRIYSQEVGGSFSVIQNGNITETTYNIRDSRVRLFERDDDCYLKITTPSEDEPTETEYGNFRLSQIKSIEFMHEPQRISISHEEEDGMEFYDWGL